MGEGAVTNSPIPHCPPQREPLRGSHPAQLPNPTPGGPGPNQAPSIPTRPSVLGSGAPSWQDTALIHRLGSAGHRINAHKVKWPMTGPKGGTVFPPHGTPMSSHWGGARLPGLVPVPGHSRLSPELGRDTGVRLRSQWASPRGRLPPLEHGDGCRWAEEEKNDGWPGPGPSPSHPRTPYVA